MSGVRGLGVFVCALVAALGVAGSTIAQDRLTPVHTPAGGAAKDAAITLVDAGPARATLVPSPAAAEIGEPVEWLLDVSHPAAMRVKFPAKPVEDRAWVMLGERTVVRAPDPSDPEIVHTIARWSAMALDAGQQAPAPLELDVAGGGVQQKLVVSGLPVEITAALAEGEDAPRPLLGFRELPPGLEPARTQGRILIGGIAVLVLGLVCLWIRKRRKAPLPPAAQKPVEHLDALVRRVATEPESARAIVFELSRLVRGSVDAFLGVERSGATDEDWARAVEGDERIPLGVRNASVRLLASVERIKYAQELPTRFAVDEYLKDARAALEALADAPRPFAEKAAA